MVAHAFIDERLRVLLKAFFTRMSGPNDKLFDEILDGGMLSMLGSYSHRARMARVLGLINDKAWRALKAFNKLRIPFAHTSHADLSEGEVGTLIAALDKDTRKALESFRVSVFDSGKKVGFTKTLFNEGHRLSRRRCMLIATLLVGIIESAIHREEEQHKVAKPLTAKPHDHSLPPQQEKPSPFLQSEACPKPPATPAE
jgi:hypothetical protein